MWIKMDWLAFCVYWIQLMNVFLCDLIWIWSFWFCVIGFCVLILCFGKNLQTFGFCCLWLMWSWYLHCDLLIKLNLVCAVELSVDCEKFWYMQCKSNLIFLFWIQSYTISWTGWDCNTEACGPQFMNAASNLANRYRTIIMILREVVTVSWLFEHLFAV